MRAGIQRHRRGTALLFALAAAGLPQGAPAATRGYIALAVPPANNNEVLQAAIDLNGDGTPDNQFAQVLIALRSGACWIWIPQGPLPPARWCTFCA